jgi:hypothetical protein
MNDYRALAETEPKHYETEFKRFVNEFGTHYARFS